MYTHTPFTLNILQALRLQYKHHIFYITSYLIGWLIAGEESNDVLHVYTHIHTKHN